MNFPMAINRNENTTFTRKKPRAIPITSPIRGSQENKASHTPY